MSSSTPLDESFAWAGRVRESCSDIRVLSSPAAATGESRLESAARCDESYCMPQPRRRWSLFLAGVLAFAAPRSVSGAVGLPPEIEPGRRLFDALCVTCHGVQGAGGN